MGYFKAHHIWSHPLLSRPVCFRATLLIPRAGRVPRDYPWAPVDRGQSFLQIVANQNPLAVDVHSNKAMSAEANRRPTDPVTAVRATSGRTNGELPRPAGRRCLHQSPHPSTAVSTIRTVPVSALPLNALWYWTRKGAHRRH